MPFPVTFFVMTYNEERNLRDCLDSIKDFAAQIIVLDSYSTDKTLDIAREYTSHIYQNKWTNHAKQYLWGMDNCDISHDWIVRIDADERWTKEGLAQLAKIIEEGKYSGVSVRMKIYFMDKWLRHGGMYPNFFLRAYRRTCGQMEDRWMDEHIQVDGPVLHSSIDVIECNYDRMRNLSLWTDKHNSYSTREAIDFLIDKHHLGGKETIANPFGSKTERKRWLKERVYNRTPYFSRPVLYFAYRYFLQCGFLDGKNGMLYHSLHALWYRFLVDAKAYQIEYNAKQENLTIKEAIYKHHGIQL